MDESKQLVGGEVELEGASGIASISDPLARQALSDVTDRYNQMTNSMYRAIPTGGTVTRQTVNGIMFRFKGLTFSVTTVRNNADAMGKFTPEECPLAEMCRLESKKVDAEVYWDRETMEVNTFYLTD